MLQLSSTLHEGMEKLRFSPVLNLKDFLRSLAPGVLPHPDPQKNRVKRITLFWVCEHTQP